MPYTYINGQMKWVEPVKPVVPLAPAPVVKPTSWSGNERTAPVVPQVSPRQPVVWNPTTRQYAAFAQPQPVAVQTFKPVQYRPQNTGRQIPQADANLPPEYQWQINQARNTYAANELAAQPPTWDFGNRQWQQPNTTPGVQYTYRNGKMVEVSKAAPFNQTPQTVPTYQYPSTPYQTKAQQAANKFLFDAGLLARRVANIGQILPAGSPAPASGYGGSGYGYGSGSGWGGGGGGGYSPSLPSWYLDMLSWRI